MNALIEYTQEESFNKEELESFKKGLACIGGFMNKATLERKAEDIASKQE